VSRPATAEDAPRARATETVFETILADIVRGTYPPGARLPAERELSRMLGASRPTLREALRKLSEWRLVEARRGSGVAVRPIEDWSIEVLPAYLRYARPDPDRPALPRVIADLLALRRSLILDILDLVARRVPPEGTRAAREAAQRAWDSRADRESFPSLDLAVLRAVVESAGLLPALWLLNRMSDVYLDIARTLTAALPPPADYLRAYAKLCDALDAGDAARARAIFGEYLARHDERLTAIFGSNRKSR
jgi:GntR family transcriptional regulator, transcriptional repressor for pyruvate dehydrogenase complex